MTAAFAPFLGVVLFLFAANAFFDAQSMTPGQRGASELGDSTASITVFDATVSPGTDGGDILRAAFDDAEHSLSLNAMDFPFYLSGLRGIFYSERDWASDPPDTQSRLAAGRWPKARRPQARS